MVGKGEGQRKARIDKPPTVVLINTMLDAFA
jgi:hypothetical protein